MDFSACVRDRGHTSGLNTEIKIAGIEEVCNTEHMISIERMKSLVTRRRISRVPFNSQLAQLRAIFGREGVLSGQTVEWAGLAYSGKTGLLHHWVKEVCCSGTGVVWIDSYRTLDARSFTSIDCDHFWVVRPVQEVDALFYADLLIRSSCFGLVILEYVPELSLK